ncbi:MAG TPA: rod shape-determining protein MreC [Bryobacteraceae bacterium]|nr:rod shape-determining protein MreC [Bryobacteraceae bacterium]
MEALLNRYRNLTVLLVVVMAQLVLLAYQVKTNQDVRLIRVWAVTAVTPLARVLEFARQNTVGIAEDYFVLVKVRERNRELTDENGRLKLENQFLKSQLQTAERARLLSAFQERTPSKTLPARIIGNVTGSNARVVFIDRGSTDGVMRGVAVVTPEGIVGKVLASYPTAAQVQLITDGTFAAGVISQKNRVHGTVKGTGQSKCIVDYVQNEEKVEPGEMFFTSGDDRVFPKGMAVGTATVVKQGKSFKEIYLIPAAFQQGLEEVLVVLEGVHQAIPDRNAVAAAGVKILPPPPAEPGQTRTPSAGTAPAAGVAISGDLRSGLSTPADRLKERYKRVGELQNHTFGEGLPGSKPPDFTINPDDPKFKAQPGAAAPPTSAGQPAAAATSQATPGITTSAVKPQPTPGAAGPSPAKPTTSPAAVPPAARPANLPAQSGAVRSATGTSAGPVAKPPLAGAGTPTRDTAGVKPSTPGTPPGGTAGVKPPVSGTGSVAAAKPATSQPTPATVKPSSTSTARPGLSTTTSPAKPPAEPAAKPSATPGAAKPKPPAATPEPDRAAPTGIRNRAAAPAPESAPPKARKPAPGDSEGLPFP